MKKRILKKKVSKLSDEFLIDLHMERRLNKRMRKFVQDEVHRRFYVAMTTIEINMVKMMMAGEDDAC